MTSESILDKLSIAAPCSADWEKMTGDERARFCSLCRKHVYNISAMSRTEAEALIREKEGGRVCLRMFKRADGTVVVDNCPVGLRAIRNRLRWAAGGLAAAVVLVGGIVLACTSDRFRPGRGSSLREWFFPPKPVRVPHSPPHCMTGDVYIAPRTSSTVTD